MSIKKVLISQPEPSHAGSPYEKLAEKTGVELVFCPFIRVEGISSYEFRKQKVDFAKFPSVIFVSRVAVTHFFRLAEELRYPVPETTRYFCLTENIANFLQKYTVYRKRKIFISEDGTMTNLIGQMDKYKKERFLLPLADVHKPDVPRELKRNGVRYTKAILYRTVSTDLTHLDLSEFDLLVFYSPLGIKSLQQNFPDYQQGDTIIAGFGKSTHSTLKSAGLTLHIKVPTAKCKSMTEALEEFILTHNKEGNE